ncbi:MAG: AI-2E family transporter [Burkholderiales bacterium]|nr:AI-2E family transporter [Anaerolineae bacterium]
MSNTQIFRGTLVFLLALGLAYILVLTRGVWVGLLIAILVASAVRPAILRLIRWGVPAGMAVILVYLGIALVTILVLVIILPPVVNQFVGYIQNDNLLANRIIAAQSWFQRTASQFMGTDFQTGITPDDIRTAVSDLVETVRITAPSLIGEVTSFLGDFILMIVMGIYWFTSRERAVLFISSLVPLSRRALVGVMMDEIEMGLGAYVRGIVFVSVIMGFLCFVTLTILRVPGAATLSFFYAVATAIPIIGGFVGVALATFLALLTSPLNAVIVLVVTALLQQVENYWLTPRAMSKATDFDPLLVILFVAAGFTLGGIMGSLIALPLAGSVSVIVKYLILEPRKAQTTSTRVDGGILLKSTPNSDSP